MTNIHATMSARDEQINFQVQEKKSPGFRDSNKKILAPQAIARTKKMKRDFFFRDFVRSLSRRHF